MHVLMMDLAAWATLDSNQQFFRRYTVRSTLLLVLIPETILSFLLVGQHLPYCSGYMALEAWTDMYQVNTGLKRPETVDLGAGGSAKGKHYPGLPKRSRMTKRRQ
jgi:hypothetical protein